MTLISGFLEIILSMTLPDQKILIAYRSDF